MPECTLPGCARPTDPAAYACADCAAALVHITRADYRIRVFGRWWKVRGRYNVGIPGVMVVGPVRRRDIPEWVEHVLRHARQVCGG